MQKIIVLGASSGIGREIARLYATQGCMVGITGRREKLLTELQTEFPDRFIVSAFDISEISTVERYLDELVRRLNGLDVLILSAGYGKRNSELDAEPEQQAIRTDVAGFTAVVGWAFKYFKQQDYGHIVAISSIAGLRGNRYSPAYSASKVYNMNYLQSLRQLAHHQKINVGITDVRPGFVDTQMAQGQGVFWSASVPKAAAQIVKAIEKKKDIVYITRRWKYVAVVIRLIPRIIFERL
ncbi:MAG: oxidoreductase [Bacteroidetes bacterium]|jgi:short-subunit dehydrogenase|nr:oxidoreductase [Bacteroidota bacterium]